MVHMGHDLMKVANLVSNSHQTTEKQPLAAVHLYTHVVVDVLKPNYLVYDFIVACPDCGDLCGRFVSGWKE